MNASGMVREIRNVTVIAPNIASRAMPWSTWIVVASQAKLHQHHHSTASMAMPWPTPSRLR